MKDVIKILKKVGAVLTNDHFVLTSGRHTSAYINPDKHQLLERGFDTMIKDKNVLIVEDITATGSSVIKVIKSVREAGGIVKGIAVIVNRDPKIVNSETFGRIPFTSLVVLKIKSYEEKNCPLCKKGIPINVKIGHGKKYLEERGKK